MKNKKKAFTIVELVIVIAVIGVLSAILIPVFINLVAQANRANDDSLVRNLNMSLALEELEDRDTKNISPSDVIKDLSYYGYVEDNLITKSEASLLWNEKDNRFHLSTSLKSDAIKASYYEFIINDTNNSYAKYLRSPYPTATFNNINYSLDVGNNNSITNISYVNSDDPSLLITINTNKGDDYITDQEINGNLSSYRHYGNLNSLNIINAKAYYEYGKAKDNKLTIHNGKVIIGALSNINQVLVASGTEDIIIQTYKEIEVVVSTLDESRVTLIDESSSSSLLNGYIHNETELREAASKGGVYALGENFNVSEGLIVVANSKSFSLDLNGYVITELDTKYLFQNSGNFTLLDRKGTGSIHSTKGVLRNDGGDVEILNGRYYASQSDAVTFYNFSGHLNVRDGYFNSTQFVINMNGGVTTIDNGEFVCSGSNSNVFGLYYDCSLIINDIDVNSSCGLLKATRNSSVVINDGNYYVHKDTPYAVGLAFLVIDYQLYQPGDFPNITINGGDFTLRSDNHYFIEIDNKNSVSGAQGSLNIIGDTSITLLKEDDSISDKLMYGHESSLDMVTFASSVTSNTPLPY